MPRLPRAFPSPRRSPISRAMIKALLVELNRLARLAEVGVGVAEVAEGVAFAAPVTDFALDD